MDIRGFRGWRYAGEDGNVTPFIAPPYDILSESDLKVLLDRSDRNIVAVDVPHFPPGSAGPDSAYAAAAGRLAQWQSDGTLVQDSAPSVYAYEQEYTWAGRTYVRRALLAGVRATPFGEDVIPHEHTFPGPKADRMKLTEHTHMQLSPIFGFYADEHRRVQDTLDAQCHRPPDAHAVLHGVQERIWVISDAQAVEAIASAVRSTPVYIADGHHRYTTAMEYAKRLRDSGQIGPDHPANFVLFALVARDDPGLVILPTHRMVSGLGNDFQLARLRERATDFTWWNADVSLDDLADPTELLAAYGPGAMVLTDGALVCVAALRDPDAMLTACPDQTKEWRELDVAVLQKLILEGHLGAWRTDATRVEYTARGSEAIDALRTGRVQLCVLLQSTPLSAVETIANQGGSMPHKSTYFYPKIATGMVLKPVQ